MSISTCSSFNWFKRHNPTWVYVSHCSQFDNSIFFLLDHSCKIVQHVFKHFGRLQTTSIILLLPCGPSYLAPASAQPYSAMPFCNSKSPRLPIIFRFILVTDEIIRSSFLRIEVLTLADSPLIKQCKFENWLNIRLWTSYSYLLFPVLAHYQTIDLSFPICKAYIRVHDVVSPNCLTHIHLSCISEVNSIT